MAASRFSMGGAWAGHFVDPNSIRVKEGPIYRVTAQLVEVRGGIDGTMIDLEPTYEVPYRRYIEGMPPADHQRCRLFAERFKDATVRLSLPERSRLTGQMDGDEVEFVKCYEGPQTVVWMSEEKEILTEQVSNHRVHYKGRLDGRGEVLDGTWSIRPPGILGMLGKSLAEGTFHLVRQSS